MKKKVHKPLLQINNLSKHFGGILAVDDISLDIYPGEVVGIVGDNGAGKSTFIKMISGVYTPDKGEVLFNDTVITKLSTREIRNIGIETIYQDLALADNLDVSSNIFLGRELVKNKILKTKDYQKMLKESQNTLDELGFELPYIKRRVHDLSGGQRQGVAIARAVHWEAKLLIMDEPTASLDLGEIEKIYELIRSLQKKNIAIIIISHNLNDIFEVCDRVVVLRLSKKISELKVEDTNMQEVVDLIVGE